MLVGFETNDDAAVYRLSEDHALVSTVDFITPPVDDPVWFGRIAAANSLSDVYAMGGRPLTALSLVMFPAKKLGLEVLRGILQGGYEKVAEAGASLCGGHSVEDEEPKYGLAVTGLVNPRRILTNTGVRPGDVLILTKPIGTGVLFNANRSRKLPWSELEPVLTEVAALNRLALEVALPFEISACTDVTGFGLLGHPGDGCGKPCRYPNRFLCPADIPECTGHVPQGGNHGQQRGQPEAGSRSFAHGGEVVQGARRAPF